MHLDDPRFPPLLEARPVKAPRRPFAEACRLVRAGELGAGDLLWSRNTARAELAVVLEPEVALERALQMGPLMMVALGDCLGALAPPKVAIHYRWPGGILLNGALAGAVRLAAPGAALAEVPRWLVAGAELDIAAPRKERTEWSRTSLEEEAGRGLTRTDILQSLSAHFLTWLNIWQEEGFRPVHDQWLFRAEGREAPARFARGREEIEGRVVGLDEGAGLLLETGAGRVQSLDLLPHVEVAEPSRAAP